MCRPYKLHGGETSNVVRVGDGGTDAKTGGGGDIWTSTEGKMMGILGEGC